MPSAISAAKPIVSDSVGCGWTVSDEVLGVGAHLERVDRLGDQLARVRADDARRRAGGASRARTGASSRPRRGRATARGRTPPTGSSPSRPRSRAPSPRSPSAPSTRPRGRCRRPTGSSAASKLASWPAQTSAATLPSCVALWASIGSPTMSPIAWMCGDVRAHLAVDGDEPALVDEDAGRLGADQRRRSAGGRRRAGRGRTPAARAPCRPRTSPAGRRRPPRSTRPSS